MRPSRKSRELPVSQKDLAKYLGVSTTLLSMTHTGKHGSRQLGSSSLIKKAELVFAYQQFGKTAAKIISIRKTETRFSKDPAKREERILLDAQYAHSLSCILQERLDEMIKKEKEDLNWLNTVDQLLATLPKTQKTKGDRLWLGLQQDVILKRLEKNNRLVQARLEIRIGTEKIKARVLKDFHKKLLGDQ